MLRGSLSRTTAKELFSLPSGGLRVYYPEAAVTSLLSGKQNGHPDFQTVPTNSLHPILEWEWTPTRHEKHTSNA